MLQPKIFADRFAAWVNLYFDCVLLLTPSEFEYKCCCHTNQPKDNARKQRDERRKIRKHDNNSFRFSCKNAQNNEINTDCGKHKNGMPALTYKPNNQRADHETHTVTKDDCLAESKISCCVGTVGLGKNRMSIRIEVIGTNKADAPKYAQHSLRRKEYCPAILQLHILILSVSRPLRAAAQLLIMRPF